VCSQFCVVSVGGVPEVSVAENYCFWILIVLFPILFVFCQDPIVENAF
jgi:hypothetical protein